MKSWEIDHQWIRTYRADYIMSFWASYRCSNLIKHYKPPQMTQLWMSDCTGWVVYGCLKIVYLTLQYLYFPKWKLHTLILQHSFPRRSFWHKLKVWFLTNKSVNGRYTYTHIFGKVSWLDCSVIAEFNGQTLHIEFFFTDFDDERSIHQ